MLQRRIDQAGLAIGFLTRLPLGRHLAHCPQLRDCVWAFPLVGLLVALPGAAVLLLAPGVITAILAIGFSVWITGGLHEDGLADLADGLGGRDPEQRLAIMRDSRIGSFGVLALGFITALRVAALVVLPGPAAALIAAAMLSRAGMGLAMRLPPARPSGLGADAGRPAPEQVLAGGAAALLAAVVLLGLPAALIAVFAALLAQTVLAWQAHHRLGGQTGDVLGAVQQLGEAAVLVALALFFG